MQPGLLSVELRDDRTQERDVVLFDLVYVALVGNTQAQVGAVELQRYDRLEPLHELLFEVCALIRSRQFCHISLYVCVLFNMIRVALFLM